jgi:adenylate cyclase class IV
VGLPGKAAGRASREELRKTPGTEVEVKLRVADRKAVVRQLQKLKAKRGARMHEMNTLYDTPAGSLARQGKLVRIRMLSPAELRGAGKPPGKKGAASLPGAVLTYKGPAQEDGRASFHGHRYKIREEHELNVPDAAALERVFEGMGLQPWFRYEKYRTTYCLPGLAGLVVELDETPIGDFLELEGDAAAIDRGAMLLGYRPAEYITKSYGQLFVEQRRSAAGVGSSAGDPALAEASAGMLFRRGE